MTGAHNNIYVGVIDDDESMCRSLGRLLRGVGMHAITYQSAEQFLEDSKRPQFDCLILDVRMERMSGTELQQQLVAAGDTTPIIFLTAHDDPEAREQAEHAGCIGYFRKTVPGACVLDAIRGIVGLRDQQN